MNVNGLLTKRWLSHLESNQNSGYQKPVCSRYTMGQAELWILYHISFAHRPVRMHLMRCGLLMLICITSCGLLRRNGARTPARASASRTPPFGRRGDTTRNGRFARPVAHHANQSLAVPLRTPLATAYAAHFVRGIPFLTHAPLARPSSMARFPS